MSHNDQDQPQVLDSAVVVAYPSKDTAGPGPHPVPVPPPAVTDHEGYPQKVPPSRETTFKGDGFWRGCCAGLCCYCCLELCF